MWTPEGVQKLVTPDNAVHSNSFQAAADAPEPTEDLTTTFKPMSSWSTSPDPKLGSESSHQSAAHLSTCFHRLGPSLCLDLTKVL